MPVGQPVAQPCYVIWYEPVSLPKSTVLVFSDPELYNSICDFCRCMQNVVINERFHVVRTLCDSCRTIVSHHEPNQCPGGSQDCETFRYVDEVGESPPSAAGATRPRRANAAEAPAAPCRGPESRTGRAEAAAVVARRRSP